MLCVYHISPLYSQTARASTQVLNRFFSGDTRYIANIAKVKNHLGRNPRLLEAENWKYGTIWRNPELGNVIPKDATQGLRSSNVLRFSVESDDIMYEVEGYEYYFYKPTSLASLNITLPYDEDIYTNYVAVVYAKINNSNVVRFVAYFDEKYNFEAVMNTPYDIYIIKGHYYRISSVSETVKKNPYPALFTVETGNQSIMGVINTQGNPIYWIAEDNTIAEIRLFYLTLGIVHSLRLAPKIIEPNLRIRNKILRGVFESQVIDPFDELDPSKVTLPE